MDVIVSWAVSQLTARWVVPGVMWNKSGSLVSNKRMKLIFSIGILCLVPFLGAVVCVAQEVESSTADNSRDVTRVVGFQCPGGELNRPRPDAILRLGNVTKKALDLPRPVYPKGARAYGNVRAEVVININTGRVVWARVLNGHPLLQEAVSNVVCRARFAPTNDVNGRVNGIIIYRFGQRR